MSKPSQGEKTQDKNCQMEKRRKNKIENIIHGYKEGKIQRKKKEAKKKGRKERKN